MEDRRPDGRAPLAVNAMVFDLEVNGRRRAVSVEPAGSMYTVSVDGRVWTVDAILIDPRTISLLVFGDQPASHEVGVAETVTPGELAVQVDGVTVTVAMNGGRRRWGGRDGGADHPGSGPYRLAAPMPGKVIRVLVKQGDRVTARQALVIVEAMKMENELRAVRDGVVTEVRTAEGVSVEAGSLLIVVESDG